MSKLIKLSKIIDNINKKIFNFFSMFIIGIIVVGFIVLVMRYLLNFGRIWIYEIMDYIFTILITTSIAGAWINKSHVSIDIFFSRFSGKTRAYVNLIGSVVIVPLLFISILFFSSDYVFSSWQQLEGSKQTGGLGGLFIIKTFMLIMAILVIFQSISETIKSVVQLKLFNERSF